MTDSEPPIDLQLPEPPPFWTLRRLLLAGALVLLSAIAVWAAYTWQDQRRQAAVKRCWIRSTNNIVETFPHTVDFEYYVDEAFRDDVIILSMGEEKGITYAPLDANGYGKFSLTYTKPGFNAIRLFANREPIGRLPVIIKGPKWIVTTGSPQNLHPVSPQIQNGAVSIAEDSIKPFWQDTMKVLYTQFRTYGDYGISGDSCRVLIKLRCPPSVYNAQNPKVALKLWCLGGSVAYTLDKSTSERDIFHQVSEKIMAPEQQLRLFQQDVSDWSVMEFICQGQHYTLKLNGRVLHQDTYRFPLSRLHGLSLGFRGIGEIDRVQLYDGKDVLRYDEDF